MVRVAILKKEAMHPRLNLEGADLPHVESFLVYLEDFMLNSFLWFFRRFPQINVGGDSAHLSSYGKRTREPRLARPQKGMLHQLATPLGTFCELGLF